MSPFAKRFGAVIIGVALIVGSFAIGNYHGLHQTVTLQNIASDVYNKENGKPGSVDFSPFWHAWSILNDKFVDTHGHGTTTDQSKVYGAIKGLTDSLGDPYTTFFPPAEAKEFNSEISGNFEGVGMEVGVDKDGIITVIAPLKGSPSELAGVKSGDKILEINGTTTSNLSVDQAVNIMRGKKGTTVTVTLLGTNDKKPREITITRDVINIPTLDTDKRADGIFVIHLYSFTANSATLFRNALEQFVRSGDTKLILDLRGNPGGYVDAAVDMASWFLPSKDIIVKEDSEGHGEDITYTSKGYNIFNNNLKMMILVDSGSASASEILSGALSENGIAKLVGTKTFGKGSVQEVIDLTPDTSLKVTVARWLTPSGKSISLQGLTPDYEIPVTDQDIQSKVDPQLKKAVELLGGNTNLK